MKTVEITIPDELAKDAEHAGLLSCESLQRLLRNELRRRRLGEVLARMPQPAKGSNSHPGFGPKPTE
jgi:hypothetical protein